MATVDRRRRVELRRSLHNSHPESTALVEQGLGERARGLPEDDTEALLEHSAGTPVQWMPGEGWLDLEELNPGELVTNGRE